MPCLDRFSQWSQQVSTAFGHLSKPQVWGLVLWSVGIALSAAAGIVQISALLALVKARPVGEETCDWISRRNIGWVVLCVDAWDW